MKIAIIGTGISGLGAAYLLHRDHDIAVYEKNDYKGGHSRTIDIDVGGETLPVDTGFIVYNERNYPHLTGLFEHLDVPVQKSDMSFGVSIDNGWLEYSSNNMLAQKENLRRPAFYKMIADILKFNRQSLVLLEKDREITLGAFFDELKMGAWFRSYYMQAMGAAIWSTSHEKILDFPAQTFVRFFHNHGLLSVNNRPQWYTVTGGSRQYVRRLTAGFQDKIKTQCGAVKVTRKGDKVTVEDSRGEAETFDHVIFACHADEALRMIDFPSLDEGEILGAFGYQDNRVVVHTDTSFMPANKQAWASWVYLSEERTDAHKDVSLSYWMNNLQKLDTDVPVIITLNPRRRPKEELILNEHVFSHPVFTLEAVQAQKKIERIQGYKNCWHCGAYQRYGFHEDGLRSAVAVAEALGAKTPWD